MPSRHPSFEQLTDLAEGRLQAKQETRLQQHVTECRRCAADVEWLHHTIAAMRTDDMPEVPTHVVARAARLARQRAAAQPAERPALVQRLVGVLRFDSLTSTPAYGVRAAAAPAARQLIFEADPYEVDVRASFGSGGCTVLGQILGAADAGRGRAQLTGDAVTVEAELSNLLEFRLPPVPAGRYTLRLHLTDVEIDISPLEFKP